MAFSMRCLVIGVCLHLGADGARVLMYVPAGGKSMTNMFYGLGDALVDRGHEVVFLTPYMSSSARSGIKQIVPEGLARVSADENMPNMFDIQKFGLHTSFNQFYSIFVDGPREVFQSKEFDQLLTEKFDIVILSAFGYASYVVPYLLKAPFVVLTQIAYLPVLTGPLGSPSLPAISPLPFSKSTDRMGFLERVCNTVGHVAMHVVLRLLYMPLCDRLVADKFGAGAIPPAAEIERNVSLVLQTSNPITDYHRPLLPNVIPVGGLHCARPRPLPAQLRDFLGESEFILFSLGSVARPQDMTPAQREAVLAALGAVPFKVLLKWDTADRAGVPTNVLPSKWLPQQDLLGSGKCRLFITHGGFASVLESLCHGVPMVTVPFGADQAFNAANAARLGVAEPASWDQLTAHSLRAAVTAALSADHRAAARHQRHLLDSQPVHPRDLAVHWVEHVIRHRGAPHLRSVAADLYWFQYYSLDVLAFLLAVLALLLKLLAVLLRCCCRCLCRRKAPAPPQAKTKGKRAKRD